MQTTSENKARFAEILKSRLDEVSEAFTEQSIKDQVDVVLESMANADVEDPTRTLVETYVETATALEVLVSLFGGPMASFVMMLGTPPQQLVEMVIQGVTNEQSLSNHFAQLLVEVHSAATGTPLVTEDLDGDVQVDPYGYARALSEAKGEEVTPSDAAQEVIDAFAALTTNQAA